jgi:hypothetical protein
MNWPAALAASSQAGRRGFLIEPRKYSLRLYLPVALINLPFQTHAEGRVNPGLYNELGLTLLRVGLAVS